MMFTAEHTCARLRSSRTCAQEEIELESFQRDVYAHVPFPPGAGDEEYRAVIPFPVTIVPSGLVAPG